jgi:hypothetical protein
MDQVMANLRDCIVRFQYAGSAGENKAGGGGREIASRSGARPLYIARCPPETGPWMIEMPG